MSDISIQTLMEKVVRAFQPEKSAGIDAKIQFNLTGEQGGDWVAVIRDQKLMVEPGTIPDPNLTFGANTEDILNMFQGKLNPMQAYMTGKVQMKGDMGLAMRLASIFKRPN